MTDAYVYEFVGTEEGLHVTREATRKLTLSELQKGVGGYIELVRTAQNLCMVVNEEGLMKDLPINRTATALLHPKYGGQEIRGNVYVLHYELD